MKFLISFSLMIWLSAASAAPIHRFEIHENFPRFAEYLEGIDDSLLNDWLKEVERLAEQRNVEVTNIHELTGLIENDPIIQTGWNNAQLEALDQLAMAALARHLIDPEQKSEKVTPDVKSALQFLTVATAFNPAGRVCVNKDARIEGPCINSTGGSEALTAHGTLRTSDSSSKNPVHFSINHRTPEVTEPPPEDFIARSQAGPIELPVSISALLVAPNVTSLCRLGVNDFNPIEVPRELRLSEDNRETLKIFTDSAGQAARLYGPPFRCWDGQKISLAEGIFTAKLSYGLTTVDLIQGVVPLYVVCGFGVGGCKTAVSFCVAANVLMGNDVDIPSCFEAVSTVFPGRVNFGGDLSLSLASECGVVPGTPPISRPGFIESQSVLESAGFKYGTNYQLPPVSGSTSFHVFPTPTFTGSRGTGVLTSTFRFLDLQSGEPNFIFLAADSLRFYRDLTLADCSVAVDGKRSTSDIIIDHEYHATIETVFFQIPPFFVDLRVSARRVNNNYIPPLNLAATSAMPSEDVKCSRLSAGTIQCMPH